MPKAQSRADVLVGPTQMLSETTSMQGVLGDAMVAISGVIAVGKTTLGRSIAQITGARFMEEPYAVNPFLERFYGDMGRWALQTQIWFALTRRSLHSEVEATHAAGIATITDRSLDEDAIFAGVLAKNGGMSREEAGLYADLWPLISWDRRPHDLWVYLRAPPEVCLARCHARGRPMEEDVTIDYMRELVAAYDAWARSLGELCLWVDWTTFGSPEDVVARIVTALSKKN